MGRTLGTVPGRRATSKFRGCGWPFRHPQAAAALKKHRLRPRRSAQVAVVQDPGSTPLDEPEQAEDSRAP
jgi:hypothetical protein